MQSYSNFDTINLYGHVRVDKLHLNRFRTREAYFGGFKLQIPEKVDYKSSGIFIPSFCNISDTTLEILQSIYPSTFVKNIIKYNKIYYYIDGNIINEGLFVPSNLLCEKFNIDPKFFKNGKITLDTLFSMGVITAYEEADKVFGNDIRNLNINGLYDYYCLENVIGQKIQIKKTKGLFRDKITCGNISELPEELTEVAQKMESNQNLNLVKISSLGGYDIVNLHAKKSNSYGMYGQKIYFKYGLKENSKRYFIESIDGVISFRELQQKINALGASHMPLLENGYSSKEQIIVRSEGICMVPSILDDTHIKAGLQIFLENEKGNYKVFYHSPKFLMSCSDNTFWVKRF